MVYQVYEMFCPRSGYICLVGKCMIGQDYQKKIVWNSLLHALKKRCSACIAQCYCYCCGRGATSG